MCYVICYSVELRNGIYEVFVMEPIVSAKGHTGQIDLYENRIEIRRKGFMSFALHGFDGVKIIFLKSLTGIQFKEVGKMTAGYLQFIFSGSIESSKGIFDATKDENTVMFNSKEQQENFEKIKNYICERV